MIQVGIFLKTFLNHGKGGLLLLIQQINSDALLLFDDGPLLALDKLLPFKFEKLKANLRLIPIKNNSYLEGHLNNNFKLFKSWLIPKDEVVGHTTEVQPCCDNSPIPVAIPMSGIKLWRCDKDATSSQLCCTTCLQTTQQPHCMQLHESWPYTKLDSHKLQRTESSC